MMAGSLAHPCPPPPPSANQSLDPASPLSTLMPVGLLDIKQAQVRQGRGGGGELIIRQALVQGGGGCCWALSMASCLCV